MVQQETIRKIPYGLSLSAGLIHTIDNKRGDVSRSKFIQRILEENVLALESNRKSVTRRKSSIAKRCRDLSAI